CPGAAQRSRGAIPRRADGRPGPGCGPRGPRAHRGAPGAWRDDFPDDASTRRGGTSVRSRSDPEHDHAYDRPSRRAARAPLRQDARHQDSRTTPRSCACLCRRTRGRRLARDGASSYVLAVSDSAVAAPAVTRALVEASANVLSIGESRHSLEDVYLELVDEDVEAAEMSMSARR